MFMGMDIVIFIKFKILPSDVFDHNKYIIIEDTIREEVMH